jgi:hypothetical protein
LDAETARTIATFLTDIKIVAAFGVAGFFGHCPDGRRSELDLRATRFHGQGRADALQGSELKLTKVGSWTEFRCRLDTKEP